MVLEPRRRGTHSLCTQVLGEGELTHSVPRSSGKAALFLSDPVVYLEEVNEGCFLGCTGRQMEWNLRACASVEDDI